MRRMRPSARVEAASSGRRVSSLCRPLCLSAALPPCLSPSASLPLCLSASLPVYLSVFSWLCLRLSPSVSLSLSRLHLFPLCARRRCLSVSSAAPHPIAPHPTPPRTPTTTCHTSLIARLLAVRSRPRLLGRLARCGRRDDRGRFGWAARRDCPTGWRLARCGRRDDRGRFGRAARRDCPWLLGRLARCGRRHHRRRFGWDARFNRPTEWGRSVCRRPEPPAGLLCPAD